MAPGGESHGLFWSFDVPTAAAIQIRWAITTVWHDKHGRFSIGAQFGGPNVGHIPRLKKELRELLNESCDSTGSDTIDHIALVLRINGPITDFGAEGVDRVRHQAKQRMVGADIVIPQNIVECPSDSTREYLAKYVRITLES